MQIALRRKNLHLQSILHSLYQNPLILPKTKAPGTIGRNYKRKYRPEYNEPKTSTAAQLIGKHSTPTVNNQMKAKKPLYPTRKKNIYHLSTATHKVIKLSGSTVK